MPLRGSHGDAPEEREHLTYHQLLDACREGQCPVCFRLDRAARKALEAVLHEQVTDPISRQRIADSHGFCALHTRILETLSNRLGVAVIYQQLLQHLVAQIRSRPASGVRGRSAQERRTPRRAGKQLVVWHGQRSECPLCASARSLEASDLATILRVFGEPEFHERFGYSAGLCLPHLLRAAELADDEASLVAVIDWHAAHWEALQNEMGEFVRKFDYRYADEPMGPERDSWLRALRVFAGTTEASPPE
jgi:hypothetical protein